MIVRSIAVFIFVFFVNPSWASPAAKADSYLRSCTSYISDELEFCKLGQKTFLENYNDAFHGRIDSWRNLGYFFQIDGNNPQLLGIKSNTELACMWRMAVLFASSNDLSQSDLSNAEKQCGSLGESIFTAATLDAREVVRHIKIVPENDPKASWAGR